MFVLLGYSSPEPLSKETKEILGNFFFFLPEFDIISGLQSSSVPSPGSIESKMKNQITHYSVSP